jgi:hypothetical protein
MTTTWNLYRTRFLVKAKKLTQPLFFVDELGREQRGRIGDYLIEASDGRRSIQRRQIFEDVYVAMGPAAEHEFLPTARAAPASELRRRMPPGRTSASA